MAAGFAAVVEAPIQGYSTGSGVLSGLGRGLLGAIGLPVSGALELVGAVSAGLASSAGIAHRPVPRRAGRDGGPAVLPAASAWDRPAAYSEEREGPAGGASGQGLLAEQLRQRAAPGGGSGGSGGAAEAAGVAASRLLAAASGALPAGLPELGAYVAHCPLEAAALSVGPGAPHAPGEARLLHAPVLLLGEAAVLVFADGGLLPLALLPLGQLQLQERPALGEATLQCAAGAVLLAGGAGGGGGGSGLAPPQSPRSPLAGEPSQGPGLVLRARMGQLAWLAVVPALRRRLPGRQD